MSEREPDIQDDPRRQGTGEGYPESENEEQTPVEGTDQGPEAGTGGEPGPDTQAGQDDEPGSATGNPGAAG
jgi:hypothetical protein